PWPYTLSLHDALPIFGSLTAPTGNVTISSPASGSTIRTTSMTLSGTQTLTPKNFDRDDTADAKFPDHGAVIGSNIPALDLKSVRSEEHTSELQSQSNL